MKQYELVVIINPSMEDAAKNDLLASIKTELENSGANNVQEDVWGSRKMAYKINGSIEGFYILYTFESAGKQDGMRKFFSLKKDIWRNMFVDLSK